MITYSNRSASHSNNILDPTTPPSAKTNSSGDRDPDREYLASPSSEDKIDPSLGLTSRGRMGGSELEGNSGPSISTLLRRSRAPSISTLLRRSRADEHGHATGSRNASPSPSGSRSQSPDISMPGALDFKELHGSSLSRTGSLKDGAVRIESPLGSKKPLNGTGLGPIPPMPHQAQTSNEDERERVGASHGNTTTTPRASVIYSNGADKAHNNGLGIGLNDNNAFSSEDEISKSKSKLSSNVLKASSSSRSDSRKDFLDPTPSNPKSVSSSSTKTVLQTSNSNINSSSKPTSSSKKDSSREKEKEREKEKSADPSSHSRSLRSTQRAVPQLPSAPGLLPAPPPAMYWSKAPVHGSVPKRAFRAHTANLADEVLWLFGGCDSKGCFRELWCFDTGESATIDGEEEIASAKTK